MILQITMKLRPASELETLWSEAYPNVGQLTDALFANVDFQGEVAVFHTFQWGI